MNLLVGTMGLSLMVGPAMLTSASAADMIENTNQPRHARIVHHVHHVSERAMHVAYDRDDCGQLFYEYRTTPPYTEIKTMCGPRPIVYDTGVIHGPAPR